MIKFKNDQIGMLAAILAALSWGIATVMSKSALMALSPITLLIFQLGISVVVLWFVVWLYHIPSASWCDMIRFAWLGLFEPGLAYFFGLIGLTHTKAASATLIQSSESMMIIVVSSILLSKRPANSFFILSITAFFGLLLALGHFDVNATANNNILGIGLIFIGTAMAAIYVVMSSQIATQANPIYIVACQQTVALIFSLLILPLGWTLPLHLPLLPNTMYLWCIVLFSGLIQYALAFSLYMYALRTVSANIAGSFLNLTPIFGIAGALIFLQEKLSLFQLFGAMITIASVILINRKKEELL